MSNSIRTGLHFSVADTILKEIQYQRSNYYFFLGKIDPWGPDDVFPNDIVINSDYEDSNIRSNVLYINKVSPTDVSLVTKRYLWVSDIVYTQYDHTIDLTDLPYYVITDEYNVYKCLSNNNGAPSTVKPIGKPTAVLKLSDGYVWKYMYAVPSFKKSKFMSFSYVPVQTSLSDSFYNNGSVDDVIVEYGGSGYTDIPNVTISSSGAVVSGSAATGYVNVDGSGKITSVTITNGGSGYIAGVNLTISTTTGSGAELIAIIVGGVITDATILASGVSYLGTDTINFVLGGLILVPGVNTAGEITKVNIVNPGIGYAGVVPLIVNSLDASGTGKYGNSSAILTAVVYEGKVVQVNIIDSGVGYSSGIGTTITVFVGDGTSASFTPVIYNGTLIDVVVNNPGKDYSEIVLTVSPSGTDDQAKILPVLGSSDFSSDQYIIEQTAVAGGLYAAVVTNPGTNYTTSTVIDIVGDGTGATAVPIVVDGSITAISMTSYGQNYTYADAVITDITRGSGIDCQSYMIISPKYGHGRDAIRELGSSTIAFTNVIKKDPSIIALAQDYRYFGLIKNPKNILTGQSIRDQNNLIAHRVTFADVTGLLIDEILNKNNIKYRVVSILNNDVVLQQIGYGYSDSAGVYVAELSGLRSYTTTAVAYIPIVDKYSGDLLFASGENPFTFTADQTFVIKTFVTV